jgi:hypothetical protein
VARLARTAFRSAIAADLRISRDTTSAASPEDAGAAITPGAITSLSEIDPKPFLREAAWVGVSTRGRLIPITLHRITLTLGACATIVATTPSAELSGSERGRNTLQVDNWYRLGDVVVASAKPIGRDRQLTIAPHAYPKRASACSTTGEFRLSRPAGPRTA